MLSCKEVSRLVSEALDRKLPLLQRMQLRLHLAMCKLCSAFNKDLRDLHELTREEAGNVVDDPDVKLSPEARQRIRRALENGDASGS